MSSLQKGKSLKNQLLQVFFLNYWSTWGFLSWYSGFSSLRMVENVRVLTQTFRTLRFHNTIPDISRTAVCSMVCTPKCYQDLITGIKIPSPVLSFHACLFMPLPAVELCFAHLCAESDCRRKQSKVFGRKLWEINLFSFLMIICSLECLDLAPCLLISIP